MLAPVKVHLGDQLFTLCQGLLLRVGLPWLAPRLWLEVLWRLLAQLVAQLIRQQLSLCQALLVLLLRLHRLAPH